jgi:hypothetical protein
MSTAILTRGRQTFRVHCVDYRSSRSTDEYVYTLDGVLADGAITYGGYGPPLTTLAAIPYADGYRQLVFADLGTTGAHTFAVPSCPLTNARQTTRAPFISVAART